tara:strand:- start:2472 stop:2807 length:336 start_codon:yes stop_codon:yes gene_type:complete
MKFNLPLTLISIILSLSLGFYLYNESKDLILVIGFVISSISILVPSLIYTSKNSRILVNTRIISLFFYFGMIILSFLKMNNSFGDNLYVLFSGILLSVFLLIAYSLNKSDL